MVGIRSSFLEGSRFDWKNWRDTIFSHSLARVIETEEVYLHGFELFTPSPNI